MKARVVELISGHNHEDKKRRITLKFEDGVLCSNRITVPETALGYIPALDDVVEFKVELISNEGHTANFNDMKKLEPEVTTHGA